MCTTNANKTDKISDVWTHLLKRTLAVATKYSISATACALNAGYSCRNKISTDILFTNRIQIPKFCEYMYYDIRICTINKFPRGVW